jgi:LCP family protein required for cell wall assembly
MNIRKIILSFVIVSIFLLTTAVPPAQASPPGDGICNGSDEVLTILVIGIDTRSLGYLYGLADTSMVIRVDFQNQDVSIVGFPRDLWVQIPDVEEDNGRTHGKFNQAYFFGTEGMGYYSGEGFGAGLMRATMLLNWGLEVDKFIVLNMRTMRDVIDAIGGIEVYNPSTVYSHHKNNPKYLPGGYFFSGSEALLYARYRDPRNVYDRVDRQALILEGLFKAIFSLKTIPKIPQIIGLYKGNVLTDMHLAELSQLLCMAAKTDLDQVRFGRIPKDFLYNPGWVGFVWLEKEPGSLLELMSEFQAGTWPQLEDG